MFAGRLILESLKLGTDIQTPGLRIDRILRVPVPEPPTSSLTSGRSSTSGGPRSRLTGSPSSCRSRSSRRTTGTRTSASAKTTSSSSPDASSATGRAIPGVTSRPSRTDAASASPARSSTGARSTTRGCEGRYAEKTGEAQTTPSLA